MSSKISDLQGIRGIAIIAVLGFHFYPKIVPNGYLGVDQFFVLSGFLMCMLLTKSENMPKLSIITNFYIRRFKRILPLYQLFILLSLIFLYSCFPEIAYESNEKTGARAMTFISNNLKMTKESYFEKVSNVVDIFTHTWSLSVEIQFYLIVPFIFLLPYKLVSFSIISIISIVYHYSIPSNIAFLNMSTRIWQFMIGMIASIVRQQMQTTYLPLNTDDCEKQEVNDFITTAQTFSFQKFVTISIILVTLFVPLNGEFSRLLVTFSTGLLLVYISGESLFLSNRILTYIGDISYSLYLIHWPLYAYWKLTRNGDMVHLFAFLVISITLSILIYESFEKWYIRSEKVIVFVLIIGLFLANLVILNYHHLNHLKTSETPGLLNTTDTFNKSSETVFDMKKLDEAKRLNAEWSKQDLVFLFLGWRNHTGLNKTSKYKIMSIGNSWAGNLEQMIYDECAKNAYSYTLGSICECEPLHTFLSQCTAELENFEKRVREEQPDYLFHITRYRSYQRNPTDNFDTDQVYQSMLKRLKLLATHVKNKIFILNAMPDISNTFEISRIVDDIKANVTFVDIDKRFGWDDEYLIARKRYAQLVKDCGSKCELVDYLDLFYKNDTKTFRFFDDFGHSYFTMPRHLTPAGLELVRPVWRKACEQMV